MCSRHYERCIFQNTTVCQNVIPIRYIPSSSVTGNKLIASFCLGFLICAFCYVPWAANPDLTIIIVDIILAHLPVFDLPFTLRTSGVTSGALSTLR